MAKKTATGTITKKSTASKRTKKKTTGAKPTRVAKGEVWETKHGTLIEVTNGRLKDEGELGHSFEGRHLEFGPDGPTHSLVDDRFYVDELVRKLTKKDLTEWEEVARREAEAIRDAAADAEPAPETKRTAKKAKAKNEKPEKKPSGLDAAARVLQEAGEPLRAKEIVERMLANGYWRTNGATPAATIYAAVIREIADKGAESRFAKVDRGLFTLTDAAK